MIFLSETLGKRDQLDAIEAQTIEDFIAKCNTLFSNSEFFNACLASREWENKEGYINNDLYLPKLSKDGIPMEAKGSENSRLIKFDSSTHVKPVIKKDTTPSNGAVNNFEPASVSNGSDFDL